MINQAGEYALRAMVHLGRAPAQTPCSASEIALATKVPQTYLQKILRTLTQNKLLVAQRGMGGGFMLAQPADKISVLDVLRACDSGPSRIERCPLGIQGHTQLCSLHKLIDQQTENVESAFASTSIENLLNNTNGVQPLCEQHGNSSGKHSMNLPTDPPEPTQNG